MRLTDTDNPQSPAESNGMLDVLAVAKLLACSTRHIYRLSDGGRMPRPLKVGALNRWPRTVIEAWIAEGCPACRKGVRQ
jgi:predicted DNA-binding transcriptional regulator AlpA